MIKIQYLIPISCLCSVAQAAVLVTPTGETNLNGSSEFYAADQMIDNTGLSGAATFANYTTITHAGVLPGNAWVTNNPNGAGDYFLGGSPGTTPSFSFSLGQTYQLTDLVVWGYHFANAANGNEASEFMVEFSTNGGTTYSNLTTVSIANGSHTSQNAATLSFGGTFAANTVKISFSDNQFGGGAAGGDRVGLGELKLIAADPIPEPSSTALLGLGGIALLLRRRK